MKGATNTKRSAALLVIVGHFNATVISRGGVKMIKVRVFWVDVMATLPLVIMVIMLTRSPTVSSQKVQVVGIS